MDLYNTNEFRHDDDVASFFFSAAYMHNIHIQDPSGILLAWED